MPFPGRGGRPWAATPATWAGASCAPGPFRHRFCWVGTQRRPFPLLDRPFSHYHFAHRLAKKSRDTLEGRSWTTSFVSSFFANPVKLSNATTKPCAPSSWSGGRYPTSLADSVSPTARSAISSASSAPTVKPVKCPPFRRTGARTTQRHRRQPHRSASRNPRRRRLPHARARR